MMSPKKCYNVFLSFILVISIFGGCSAKLQNKIPSPMRTAQVLQFAVPNNLDKELLEQASLFAADVARLSGGRFNVNVISVSGEVVLDGEYDLMYLDNTQASKINPTLKTLSLPFLYNDPSHLSLALNAPDTKKSIEQRMGDAVFPMAALSSGTAVILTTKKAPRSEMAVPNFFQDLTIGRGNDSDTIAIAFQSFDAKISVVSHEQAIYFLGNHSDNYPSPINSIEASMTQVLSLPTNGQFSALKTRHSLSPIWLAANTKTWQTVSLEERAILQEAAAGLISRYEEGRIRFQASWEKEMDKQGIAIVQIERQAFATMLYAPNESSPISATPIMMDEQLYTMTQNHS